MPRWTWCLFIAVSIKCILANLITLQGVTSFPWIISLNIRYTVREIF